MNRSFLSLIIILTIIPPLVNAKNPVINRVVAVVNDQIITLSEVALFYQIKKADNATIQELKILSKNLSTSKGNEALFPMSKSESEKSTRQLIIMELLFQESKRFNIKPVPEGKSLTEFKKKFPDNSSFVVFLTNLHAGERKISTLLSKMKSAKHFITTKLNWKNVIVTDMEMIAHLTLKKIPDNKKTRARAMKYIKNRKNRKRISYFIKKLLERNHVKYIYNDS